MHEGSEQDMTSEQRAEARYPCVGSVLLYCALEPDSGSGSAPTLHQAPLQDMSLGGLAFDTATPVARGEKLVVLVPVDGGGQERLVTEVRWCRQIEAGAYRIGVCIQGSELLARSDPAQGAASNGEIDGIIGVLTSYRQVMAEGDAPEQG